MARARGEHRFTPAERAAFVRDRLGAGAPPPTPPAVAQLAAEMPVDPLAAPEVARAAIARATAAGLRLGVAGNPQRRPERTDDPPPPPLE